MRQALLSCCPSRSSLRNGLCSFGLVKFVPWQTFAKVLHGAIRRVEGGEVPFDFRGEVVVPLKGHGPNLWVGERVSIRFNSSFTARRHEQVKQSALLFFTDCASSRNQEI